MNKIKEVLINVIIGFLLLEIILFIPQLIVIQYLYLTYTNTNTTQTIIKDNNEYYTTTVFTEKDNCIMFKNKKICGNYTIIH